MWMHEPWYGFPWMWIFPLLFFIVMLLFLFRGSGWPMCGGHRTHKRENAREILDRRYASGEISREEYQRMKKDIE
ncbi:MAG: SHOCT domain-containing protein [Nitrospinae bacterium]|nr:SHOCT domain-containing protein [Nitrospinota bacterium]